MAGYNIVAVKSFDSEHMMEFLNIRILSLGFLKLLTGNIWRIFCQILIWGGQKSNLNLVFLTTKSVSYQSTRCYLIIHGVNFE